MKHAMILLASVLCVVGLSQQPMVPHLTRAGGGFVSTVYTANQTQSPQAYRFYPFTASGEALPAVEGTLAPGSVAAANADTLVGANGAYFTIDPASQVEVTVSYRSADGPGSPAHLAATAQTSSHWRILPGNWQVTFDGIAVVNRGDAATPVRIEQRDLNGSLLAQRLVIDSLPSGAKQLYVIGGPTGSDFSGCSACTFEVLASQPLAVASLRGTPPGAAVGYLWENAPIALEGSDSPPPPTPSGSWVSRGIGGGGALFSPAISPHHRGDVYLACDMSELFHTTDMGRSWEMVPFDRIQANPLSEVEFTSDPAVLYAIDVTGDAGTPVKSTDAGQTWRALPGDPTDRETFRLIADPSRTDRLVLSSYERLFFSKDGGDSFQLIYTDATDLGAFVAGAYFNNDLVLVGVNTGLLVSTDDGSSFGLQPLNGIPSDEAMVSLAAAGSGSTIRLLAVTLGFEDLYPGMTGSDAWGYRNLYRMDWGQNSWTPCSTGIETGTYPFFVDMALNDIDTAYLGGASDDATPVVYKTTNGGSSWSRVFNTQNNQNITTGWCGDGGDAYWWYPEYVLGMAVNPADAQHLVITDLGFAHVTEDGGATWRQMYVDPSAQNTSGETTPRGKSYSGIGLENTSVWWMCWSDADHIFAAFTDIGGIRSQDGGLSWSFDYAGHELNSMYYVTRHPANGAMYAATSSVHDMYQSPWLEDADIDPGTGQVLTSSDHGQTWNLIRDFQHPVIWLASDPMQSNRMYACVIHSGQGGIYRTDNLDLGAGSSWIRTATPPRTEGHPFNVHVLNDGTVVCTFSGRREGGSFTPSSGVFVSTDSGSNWIDRSDPGMQYWTKDLVIDPHDASQNTWYAGVWSGWGGPPNGLGGVYRTSDRGLSWTRIADFDRASSVAIDPNDRDRMYVTTETQGLWLTSNATSASPSFVRDDAYPFRQGERVFFNPYNPDEVWVCSFGNGLRVRLGGEQ